MSKLALVADIHLEGRTLENRIKVLSKMVDICREQKVDYILNAGDTFDCGEVGDRYAPAEKIISALESVLNIEIPVITIEGNHDQWGTNGSALDFIHFQNWTKIKDEVAILGFKDFAVGCIPWIRNNKSYDSDVIKSLSGDFNNYKTRILLGHLNLVNCHLGYGKYCDITHYYSFGIENLQNTGFNPTHMFFGHIHSKQTFGVNRLYLGALTQQKFGADEANPSGFYILDTETGSLVFYNLDQIASKYRSIEEEKFDSLYNTKDYFRFYSKYPERYVLKPNVKILRESFEERVVTSEVSEGFKTDTLSPELLIKKYCEFKKILEPKSAFYKQEIARFKVGLAKPETGIYSINKIKLKDVSVHSNLEVELKPGFTVITGRNGTGKTTLVESIPACLFGDFPSRGNVKNYMKKGSSLELEVTLPSKENVIFGKRVNSKHIVSYLNNEEFSLIGNYEQKISKMVGDQATFCKLVFMDQIGKYDLVGENKSSRLKVLRQLFDLTHFDVLYEEYSKELKEKKRQLELLVKKKEELADLRQEIDKIISYEEINKTLTIPDLRPIREKIEQLKADKVEQAKRQHIISQLAWISTYEKKYSTEELKELNLELNKLEEEINIASKWKNVGCSQNPLPCVFLKNFKQKSAEDLELLESKFADLKSKIPSDFDLYLTLASKYKGIELTEFDTRDIEAELDEAYNEEFKLRKEKMDCEFLQSKLAMVSGLKEKLHKLEQEVSSSKQEELEDKIKDLNFLCSLCSKSGLSLYIIQLLTKELQIIISDLLDKAELNLQITLHTGDSPAELDSLSILFGAEQYDISKASGGEIGLVKIIFKLAVMIYLNKHFGNYKILCMDEPTGALDTINKEIVLNLIKKLTNDFTQIIVISHDTKLMNAADNRISL